MCTRTLLTDFAPSAQDDNWAFSQYISYLNAVEVIVRIQYTFLQANDPVSVYFRNAAGELTLAQRADTSSYVPANGTVMNSRLTQPTRNTMQERQWGFLRPAGSQGFYLAIREQGATVLSISRIRLHYRVELPRSDGLLSCPAVPLPALGGTSMGTCFCAAQSVAVSGVSLDTSCNYDSVCSGGQWCGCLAGYQLQYNNQCIGGL